MRHIVLAVALAATVNASAFAQSPPPASQQHTFVPPAGWTPTPSYFVTAPPTQWRGPAPGSFIMLLRLPEFISPKMVTRVLATVAPSMMKSLAGKNAMNDVHFSTATTWLCGSAGSIITVRFASLPLQRIEVLVEARGQTTYFIVYTQSQTLSEDRFLRTVCPRASDDLAAVTPPPGWTRVVAPHPIAMWYGPVMGDTITEEQGPVEPTLDAVLATRRDPLSSMFTGMLRRGRTGMPRRRRPAVGFHMTRTHVTQTCGVPALEVMTATSSASTPTRSDTIVVQNATSSYRVMYFTRGAALDPAVLAAMHDFCP
jgi:hypothetical protein